MVEENARLLTAMGAKARIFNPSGLPLPDDDRMKPSPYYNRIVDVLEELVKFTLLTRGNSDYLTDRYSERVEAGANSSSPA